MEKLLLILILGAMSLPAQAKLCSLSFLEGRFSEKNLVLELNKPVSEQAPLKAKDSLSLLGLIHQKTNLTGELKLEEYSYLLASENRFKKIHKILKNLLKQKTISYYEIEKLAYHLTPKYDPISGFFQATFGVNLSKETKPLLE